MPIFNLIITAPIMLLPGLWLRIFDAHKEQLFDVGCIHTYTYTCVTHVSMFSINCGTGVSLMPTIVITAICDDDDIDAFTTPEIDTSNVSLSSCMCVHNALASMYT